MNFIQIMLSQSFHEKAKDNRIPTLREIVQKTKEGRARKIHFELNPVPCDLLSDDVSTIPQQLSSMYPF